MKLRCKDCGKKFDVDAFVEGQDEEVEEAVGHVRSDRL